MRGWTTGEKLEIAIYKEAESGGRGRARSTDVTRLKALLPSAEPVDVVDALLRLYTRRFIYLDKYVVGHAAPIPFEQFELHDSFFYGPPYGDFRVRVTAEGRGDFEKRAQQQPIVFISCGQWHVSEKELGQKVLALVNQTVPLRGYFAEYQSSLSNLSRHVFEALDQCVALVAVMHHRGELGTPAGTLIRASVWIEQEIAIAAFLTERLGREIEIAAYIQKGISLEGLRSQLILNPIPFETDEEVLEHFKKLLPSWKALVS